jgi:hypothetical protein
MLAWNRVLAAIRFDNHLGLDTSEIDKVRRNRELPAKPEAKLVPTQKMPEPPLGIGWAPAQ